MRRARRSDGPARVTGEPFVRQARRLCDCTITGLEGGAPRGTGLGNHRGEARRREGSFAGSGEPRGQTDWGASGSDRLGSLGVWGASGSDRWGASGSDRLGSLGVWGASGSDRWGASGSNRFRISCGENSKSVQIDPKDTDPKEAQSVLFLQCAYYSSEPREESGRVHTYLREPPHNHVGLFDW